MNLRSLVSMAFIGLLFSCQSKVEKAPESIESSVSHFTEAQAFYLKHITEAAAWMDSLRAYPSTAPEAKMLFQECRKSFKKAEAFASYLNPEVGHRLNGPALPVLTDDTQKLLLPVGLQKIEESIYLGETPQARYQKELSIALGMLNNLANRIEERPLTAQRFFISAHQQLIRVLSLSLSGFDTPVTGNGIQEAEISLRSLGEVYQLSLSPLIRSKDSALDTQFQEHLVKALAFIEQDSDFMLFDRYTFIRDYFNPLMRDWVRIRKTSGLWEGVNNKPFNFDAPTFFEANSFNTNFFAPVTNRNPSKAQTDLGKKLFFDPNLSASGNMACATCHIPEKAWADGLVVNKDKMGNPLKRNTPTLINSTFQKAFFWDGRSPNMMDQISSVFTNELEFDSSVHEFSKEILIDSAYVPLFKEAYGGLSARNTEIIRALSSYISSLNAMSSKFDRNMRGEEDSFTEQEKLGFNLYMGKALCATCHFIPLTNGTVPPFFAEHEKEVIGVPETAKNQTLDNDLGFYWRHEKEVHRGMFKTPTVRNAELTAPYMHNGVYQSLEEVMNFYNLGGGGGMGFDLPYQTLPFDKLELSQSELDALVAFTKTLTDTEIKDYD